MWFRPPESLALNDFAGVVETRMLVLCSILASMRVCSEASQHAVSADIGRASAEPGGLFRADFVAEVGDGRGKLRLAPSCHSLRCSDGFEATAPTPLTPDLGRPTVVAGRRVSPTCAGSGDRRQRELELGTARGGPAWPNTWRGGGSLGRRAGRRLFIIMRTSTAASEWQATCGRLSLPK